MKKIELTYFNDMKKVLKDQKNLKYYLLRTTFRRDTHSNLFHGRSKSFLKKNYIVQSISNQT